MPPLKAVHQVPDGRSPCSVRSQLATKPKYRHTNTYCKNELCSHTATPNSSRQRIAWIHVTRFGTRKTKAAACSVHKPLNISYLLTLQYFKYPSIDTTNIIKYDNVILLTGRHVSAIFEPSSGPIRNQNSGI